MAGAFAVTAIAAAKVGPATPAVRLMAAMIGTKLAAATAARDRRLLVVGGSSVSFGVHAGDLGAALGLEGFNLGSHAGFRLAYVLDLARRAARPGDTVLLPLEFQQYGYTGTPSDFLIDYAIWSDRPYIHGLPFDEQLAYWWGVPFEKRLLAVIQMGQRDDTAGWGMKANGDGDANHAAQRSDQNRRAVQEGFQSLPSDLLGSSLPTPQAQREIAAFVEWCHQHEVVVWATWPPMASRPELSSPAAIATFNRIRMMYVALGVPVLGEPGQFQYGQDQFFDTALHLTYEAATRRTMDIGVAASPLLHAGAP